MKRNLGVQFYKGIPLRIDNKKRGRRRRAKKFIINESEQYVWISNIYLERDWSLRPDIDIDWMFRLKYNRSKLVKANIDKDLILQFISISINRTI